MVQDPKQWFEGRPRVMFVHAHPDDETITTGGTLAALAEAGVEPLLLTLTRGEQGEVTEGPFRHLQGTDALAPHRQQELAAALTMLGVERHVFLGVPPARAEGLPPTIYEDSGMEWEDVAPEIGDDGFERHGSRRAVPSSTVGPDALTSVPAVEVLNDVLAAAHDAGAGALVSYDDGGGYGHPDHVLAHRVARAVAQALELPFWEIVSASDEGPADEGPADEGTVDEDPADEGSVDEGSVDERIVGAGPAAEVDADPESHGAAAAAAEEADSSLPVEAHDISPWMDRKVAALRMHGTQVAVDGDDIVHVGGQREPITRVEVFRRR